MCERVPVYVNVQSCELLGCLNVACPFLKSSVIASIAPCTGMLARYKLSRMLHARALVQLLYYYKPH